jgi:hypothetical protein
MVSSDIYVQVTASPERFGPPKSVIVFVPGKNIEDYKLQISRKRVGNNEVAQNLAEPLVMNVFTHRASFGPFKVARAFSSTPPPEIGSKSPEFVQNGLKAWVL